MVEEPPLVLALINGISTSQALVDTGCLVYEVYRRGVKRYRLTSYLL